MAPANPLYREFDDHDTTRQLIFDRVHEAAKTRFPIENDRYRLEVLDTKWDSDKPFGLQEQKDAIMTNASLSRKLMGRWRMIDKASGQTIDEKSGVIAHVPYLTERGTIINNGNEYVVNNQLRLRGGAYTRQKDNGDLETHFNVLPGEGRTFRVHMEPATGIFKMQVGQAQIPMYPVLKGLGVQDSEMEKWWGRGILAENKSKDDHVALHKAYVRFVGGEATESAQQAQELMAKLKGLKLDREVMKRNLGKHLPRLVDLKDQFVGAEPDVILAATKKLLAVHRGEDESDDRDSLANQVLYGPEDLFSERIAKDAGGMLQRALWKSTNRGKLVGLNGGMLSPHINSVLIGSGLASPIEEINPLEVLDQQFKVTRLGEGGVPVESIPAESKNVQPSQFGFIDPYRGPESESLGLDTRAAFQTFKGHDGQLYSTFRDVRTGKEVPLSAKDAADKVLAFPGELAKDDRMVRAMVRGKLEYVDRKEVDYELPHHSGMLNFNVNLIPMTSATQGSRILTAGKMMNQALAMRDPEAPLVRSETSVPGVSFDTLAGHKMGTVRSKQAGVVEQVRKDKIIVRNADGTKSTHDLYVNHPYNRKTFITSTPLVRAGDQIQPEQLLARSNFTDDKGDLALGKNLRVAFIPYKGLNYEDAVVISESAAKKLSSEHMYTEDLDTTEDGVHAGYNKYVSKFPTRFTKQQLKTVDETGVVRPGTIVRKGDPLVLAVGQLPVKASGQWTQLARKAGSATRDRSITWDHDSEGEVTDVYPTRQGIKVAVRAYISTQVGDKMSGRFGNKGVVAAVIPDAKMPRDAKGQPFELLQNPMTLPTRVNPAQVFEMALAKIARKTGRPVLMPAVMPDSIVDHVKKQLKLHGLSDTEDIEDPDLNRKIRKVLTGEMYYMKLHHTAEGKSGARDTGSYTSEGVPASGGFEGSKMIGNLALNSLLSHGATQTIFDMKNHKGTKNDDFWRAYKLGYAPPSPKVPMVYRKFINMMRGAGINVRKGNDGLNILAMTDKDVEKLSSGKIANAETVRSQDLQPIEGGLFDRGLTGAHGGEKWSHIELTEPMPNPVMEEPIRRLLGLTQKKLDDIIAGKVEVNGRRGGAAVKEMLARININEATDHAHEAIKSRTGAARDAAVKQLRYLTMCKETGLNPSDFVITKVPVLPPNFRPISKMASGTQLVADPNYLYQDLMYNDEALRELSKEVGNEDAADERLNTYRALKAVVGLGDPVHPKLQEQGVTGLLGHVFGKHSPKMGMFQRRVIGTRLDMAGRGVIVPNPDLDMDQVGMPEDQAWVSYRPFVVRDLVRRGMPAVEAAKAVEERTELAEDTLRREMGKRPVLITRAPALHRYNVMAAYPVLTKNKTLEVNPTIVTGFTADFDGDVMSYHVPVSDKAVEEAKEKLMPSRNLRAVRDFGIHYYPRIEYLLGLYQASTKRKAGEAKRFRSQADVLAAYRRGELDLGDEVVTGD
jgi:DNA-directed RNA polymerase subunit beta